MPVAVSSKAARAVPKELISEICVEDNPERLVAFLVKALRQRQPSSPPAARGLLREYYERLGWEDQLESKLHQSLRSQNQTDAGRAKLV